MSQGIYKIINVVNNKFYVGSTVNMSRRRARHFSELRNNRHNNKYLQAAWNKYGEKAFIFVIVNELDKGADILAAENVWLKEHVGKDYCYNLGTDATAPHLGLCGELSNSWGYKHTEEAKARISKASKERVQTEEEKAKRRKSMQGHIVSKDTKDKISATLSGQGNYWYGKKRPEHGDKVSKGVAVTNPDGFTVQFDSITSLRRAFDFTAPTVNRALKSGKPISRGPRAGFVIKYLSAGA
jgi:group I intron endonuclease